ncbi:MAG: hypothetical protein CML23_17955 [Rhizobiaceae bacterium]|nr:hypothetical protein [Rhizobiaceae bacterium]
MITIDVFRSGSSRSRHLESFFSSLKTERTARKVYQTREQARADVFDYLERFHNTRRMHPELR